ncbi:MAG: hypothetical protein ACM3MF_05035 [Anaerolineae bacterium]
MHEPQRLRFGLYAIILPAGVAHPLSKPFGGKGTFDDTLSASNRYPPC